MFKLFGVQIKTQKQKKEHFYFNQFVLDMIAMCLHFIQTIRNTAMVEA